MIIGAHVSISGGIHNAVLNAQKLGCETFQIFTKNQNQWQEKKYGSEEILKFHETLHNSDQNTARLAAHDSYLINLCAAESAKLKKSRKAFLNEIQRCTDLKIPYIIFHPGSHMGKGEEWGLQLISESLQWAIEESSGSPVMLLLETTAGQGTNLGYQIEQLKIIVDKVNIPKRLGICLDTCHIFAAGYDISDHKSYNETFVHIIDEIGIKNIQAFHLNDSKRKLGSRVDRHEVIGAGHIGEYAFRRLMNDERFMDLPGFLEIPGGERAFKECLSRLRSYRE
jgi:deoxyribonuclease-4